MCVATSSNRQGARLEKERSLYAIAHLCYEMRGTEELYNVVLEINDMFDCDDNDVDAPGVKALIVCKILLDKLRATGHKMPQRYLAIGLLLALKLEEDDSPDNLEWSKFLGMDLKQLNKMERMFCKKLSYNLSVSRKEYQNVYHDYFLTKM